MKLSRLRKTILGETGKEKIDFKQLVGMSKEDFFKRMTKAAFDKNYNPLETTSKQYDLDDINDEFEDDKNYFNDIIQYWANNKNTSAYRNILIKLLEYIFKNTIAPEPDTYTPIIDLIRTDFIDYIVKNEHLYEAYRYWMRSGGRYVGE